MRENKTVFTFCEDLLRRYPELSDLARRMSGDDTLVWFEAALKVGNSAAALVNACLERRATVRLEDAIDQMKADFTTKLQDIAAAKRDLLETEKQNKAFLEALQQQKLKWEQYGTNAGSEIERRHSLQKAQMETAENLRYLMEHYWKQLETLPEIADPAGQERARYEELLRNTWALYNRTVAL